MPIQCQYNLKNKKVIGMPILITCVSNQYKSSANPGPIWCQSWANLMSIQCHTKANWVAKPYPWGVNSVPTQCNSRSILFQSKPNVPPIKHNFGTNPLTIFYRSIANPMLIKCQSITDLIPILFKSIANPMPIQSYSCTSTLPIIFVIPVTLLFKFIAYPLSM